ncbi:MAG: hypothetical protein QOC89_358 [Paraburkholderia sp.]|nr:hypothetical protein [Paraburkholderia sp.]
MGAEVGKVPDEERGTAGHFDCEDCLDLSCSSSVQRLGDAPPCCDSRVDASIGRASRCQGKVYTANV